jgi:hypothetical protein
VGVLQQVGQQCVYPAAATCIASTAHEGMHHCPLYCASQGAVYDLQPGQHPSGYHEHPAAETARRVHQDTPTAAPPQALQHTQQRMVDRAMKDASDASAMAAAAASTAANVIPGAEDRLDATGTYLNYPGSSFLD